MSIRKPHKHAELIKAWADGAEIEERRILSNNEWSGWYSFDCTWWVDSSDYEYRIKPEPKPDVVTYLVKGLNYCWTEYDTVRLPNKGDIKIIRDGETGELKSAEVLRHG